MSVTVPPVVTQAFAFGADPAFITTPIPTTPPVDPERASYTLGFPPVTFQPLVAGGLPPDGRDFNGILNTVTAHCAYINAGQPYIFDAAVPAALTGYGVGAQIGMADGSGFWFNLSANNAVNPDTTGTGWVPSYSYGFSSITGLTGGSVTLTVSQHRRNTIVLAGTLTSNLQLIFPAHLREWRIVNQCAGAFTVTVKTAAGTGVVIPSGSFGSPVSVYGDGTNLYPTVAPFVLPLSVAPTNDSIAQRSNLGFLYATFFNQNSALENPTIGAVFVQNSGADGFLRKISPANFAAQINVGTFAGTVTNAQVPVGAVTQYAATLFSSPSLTGNPTAPTPAPGDNDTSIATTAFVQAAKQKAAGGSVVGTTGVLTNSFNTTSCTRTGTGNYTINIAPAGFSSVPHPTANITVVGVNADNIYITATSTTSLQVQIRFGTTPVDRDFNYVVLGV